MLGGKGSLRQFLAKSTVARLTNTQQPGFGRTAISQKCSCVTEEDVIMESMFGDGSRAAPLHPPLDLLGG